MFRPAADGALPGRKYIWNPFKSYFRILGSVEILSPELKVWWMETKCVSKFFIWSVFTSDSQCPKIPSFELFTYINLQLKPCFLTVDRIKLE